jgi:hypothetical protein
MKKIIATLLAIVAAGIGGVAILAARGQATARPGEIAPARVWVENRKKEDAMPVTIFGLDQDARPLRVEVTTMPAVTVTPTTIVQTKAVRQQWEHRSMTVAAGQDVGVSLTPAGNDGWEAVSAQTVPSGATVVLLKRPR